MFDLSVIYKDVRKMLEGQEEKKETLKGGDGYVCGICSRGYRG